MGFFDPFRRLFGKKAQPVPLQSDAKALQSASSAFEALQSVQSTEEIPSEAPSTIPTNEPSIELEKDSLQLGIAAGYTGKSIREIENSLQRIESQMTSKDWFLSQFKETIAGLVNILREHELNEQKRFEALQNSVNSLRLIAQISPEPIKSKLFTEIGTIEAQLSLTPKMKELLQIVKDSSEISYEDLCQKLGISVSALRGMLTNMTKRTGNIERFEKDNRGWVKYKGI